MGLTFDRLLDVYAMTFARRRLYRFHRLLYTVALRGMGVLNYRNEYVSGERALLSRLLSNRRGVVLDVGANRGNYSAMVRSVAPNLAIHAFEPHPVSFEALSKVEGVTCHHAAVGNRKGRIKLYDYADEWGSTHASVHQGVIEDIHGRQSASYEADIIRLDEFLSENAVDEVLLLKIDVEGAELDVLRGLSNYAGRIHYIQIEFNEMNTVSRTFFRDVLAELPGHNAYRVLPNSTIEITHDRAVFQEIFAFQNLLFTQERLQ